MQKEKRRDSRRGRRWLSEKGDRSNRERRRNRKGAARKTHACSPLRLLLGVLFSEGRFVGVKERRGCAFRRGNVLLYRILVVVVGRRQSTGALAPGRCIVIAGGGIVILLLLDGFGRRFEALVLTVENRHLSGKHETKEAATHMRGDVRKQAKAPNAKNVHRPGS